MSNIFETCSSRAPQRDLVERLLESYCNEHPELREMYQTDNLTNRIMQDCAINGHTLGTMLFRLAQAQLITRKEIESRYLHYVEMHPTTIFKIPTTSPNYERNQH